MSVDAAHEHPFGVLRTGVRLKLPPAAGTVWDAGVVVYTQLVTPLCVMVAFTLPEGYATVIVATRGETSGLGVVVNTIDALAVPDAPDVIVSHDASDEAVQLQPLPVTFRAAVEPPPSGGTVWDDVGHE